MPFSSSSLLKLMAKSLIRIMDVRHKAKKQVISTLTSTKLTLPSVSKVRQSLKPSISVETIHGRSTPTWKIFLYNLVRDFVAMDFSAVPTATYKVLSAW